MSRASTVRVATVRGRTAGLSSRTTRLRTGPMLRALVLLPLLLAPIFIGWRVLGRSGVDLVVRPGGRYTFTRVVTIPSIPGRLDLLAVLDLSGSYRDDLPNVQKLLPELQDRLARVSSLRMGVASFVDDPCCGGDSGDYPYRLDLPLTGDARALVAATAGLRSGSGGDGPESWLYAIASAVRDNTFRPGATRVVVLATDNNAHYRGDGSGSSAPTVDEVAALLRSEGIRLVALLPPGNAAPDARLLAAKTGGRAEPVDSSSQDLDKAILAGLRDVPLDVSPTIRAGCPIRRTSFSPAQLSGLPSGARIPFEVGFSVKPGTTPGTYRCTIDFGQAGTQPLSVRVLAE